MRILVTHEIEVKKKWLTLDTLSLKNNNPYIGETSSISQWM